MQMGFVLEEIQMAPGARQAIVQRLRRRPTRRTGMTGSAKSHLEVDPSRLWLEDDFLYLPRSNEAQSLGEQRFNHGNRSRAERPLLSSMPRAADCLPRPGGSVSERAAM
jgi:hypothetical protein